MPARSERIYLFPGQDEPHSMVMKFPSWWDRAAFFSKYRERQIDTGAPSYVDYAYLLTPWEALVLDKSCRDQFAVDCPDKYRELEPLMARFEKTLKTSKRVIVESYEWESGLD